MHLSTFLSLTHTHTQLATKLVKMITSKQEIGICMRGGNPGNAFAAAAAATVAAAALGSNEFYHIRCLFAFWSNCLPWFLADEARVARQT